MKRQRVELSQIGDWNNLNLALYKAARGKRNREDVAQFLRNPDEKLRVLQKQILNEELDVGRYRSFTIHDPKRRKIIAVSFPLRVIHHAIMNLIGGNLERSQIENSFACLPKRGVHKAVLSVQKQMRRAQFFVKIDIEQYFAAVDHNLLMEKLACRFKGNGFLRLLQKIITGYQDSSGKGLPIGSLTSQYFANFYLENIDRSILQLSETCGYARYMDDMLWFCQTRSATRSSLAKVKEGVSKLGLQIKQTPQIGRCAQGVTFCGYRIRRNRILLSRRKMKRYRTYIEKWQQSYLQGEIDGNKLQQGYAAIHGSLMPADSTGFRRKTLATIGRIEL